MGKTKRAKPPGKQRKPAARPPDDSGRPWNEFTEAHPGHPAPVNGAIYALPPRLIDAIVKENAKFFRDDELLFERDLARIAGAGFFLQRPIRNPLLSFPAEDRDKDGRSPDMEAGHQAVDENAEFIAQSMKDLGLDQQPQASKRAEFETRIEERQAGFAGWLVTHRPFRDSCEQLRRRWQPQINEIGWFPMVPISLFGETPPSPPVEDFVFFYKPWLDFYANWGIESLATWELPIVLRPQFHQLNLYHLPKMGQFGLTLFVPWYLLRDRDLQIRDLGDYKQAMSPTHHLSEWLDGKPKNWGFDRFKKMFYLYVYLELGLRQRYWDRLRGNVEPLDYAFAKMFCGMSADEGSRGTSEETVRKVRQAMYRRLRKKPAE